MKRNGVSGARDEGRQNRKNLLPVKCFDLRVLDDLVNFRTTFDAALFSISDSEFALSFVSGFAADAVTFSTGFLSDVFLGSGAESALLSLSDSLRIEARKKFNSRNEWLA